MRNVFSKKWYLILLVVGILLLSPIIIFYDKISFSPEKFTEEWVKTVISGFIFYIILKMLDNDIARRQKLNELLVFKNKINDQLIIIRNHFEKKNKLTNNELKKSFELISTIRNIYSDKIIDSEEMLNFYSSSEYLTLVNTFENLSLITQSDINNILENLEILISLIKTK